MSDRIAALRRGHSLRYMAVDRTDRIRWRAVCACGWVSKRAKSTRSAGRAYDEHLS
jgi:hypothetical protein